MPRRRACLVVPAVPASKLEKGRTLEADEIVVDLEDAVVPDAKDDARPSVSTRWPATGSRPPSRCA